MKIDIQETKNDVFVKIPVPMLACPSKAILI